MPPRPSQRNSRTTRRQGLAPRTRGQEGIRTITITITVVITRHTFLNATLLAACACLALNSCSEDEKNLAPGNSSYAVRTTLNLSVQTAPATRMSAATVQQAEDLASFRGIEDIRLLPFSVTLGNAAEPVLSTSPYYAKNAIELTKMLVNSEGTVETNTLPADKLQSVNQSAMYADVLLPVGTNSVLFYGKAMDSMGETPTDAQLHTNGALVEAGFDGTTPANITFSPKQIAATLSGESVRDELVKYLTSIANATYTDGTNSVVWPSTDKNRIALTSLKAGSSAAVQLTVQKLYTMFYKSDKPLQKAICDSILGAGNKYATADATTGKLTFKDIINGYPDVTDNLPVGAAVIEWANNKFQVVNETTWSGLNVAKTDAYVYPASLYYFANSKILTSKTEHAADYKNTATYPTWASLLDLYTDGNYVSTDTRSVAINNAIQYGVARLDVSVKIEAGADLVDFNDQAVVPNTAGFPVKAILIGQQGAADWQFEPASTTEEYIVYDNALPTMSANYGTTAVGTNYTLVLPTPAEKAVNVAIEFENNTNQYFAGVEGQVVEPGQRFYLVATLDPTNATSGTGNRVFVKDYKTVVNLTIKAESLKKAYHVIPNLNAVGLIIGLHTEEWIQSNTWQNELGWD